MENVEGRGREQLLPILSKWIKPETTIHSDRHGAYFNLEQYVDHCIDHYTVNHKNNYVDPQSGAHTQSVESNWRHCKNSLPDQGLRPYMLQSYLSTFCWHRHVKENNLDPFLFFFGVHCRTLPTIQNWQCTKLVAVVIVSLLNVVV